MSPVLHLIGIRQCCVLQKDVCGILSGELTLTVIRVYGDILGRDKAQLNWNNTIQPQETFTTNINYKTSLIKLGGKVFIREGVGVIKAHPCSL